MRCIMVEYLRDLGYRVIETRNGREALEAAAQAGPIDLLLTDVIMPGMSGRQLHRELAATRPALRVLFVSGYTDEAIVQHGILEPGTELLQKPFSPAMLGDRVRRILDAPAPRMSARGVPAGAGRGASTASSWPGPSATSGPSSRSSSR